MSVLPQTMTMLHLSAALSALGQIAAEAAKVGDAPAVALLNQLRQQIRALLNQLEIATPAEGDETLEDDEPAELHRSHHQPHV